MKIFLKSSLRTCLVLFVGVSSLIASIKCEADTSIPIADLFKKAEYGGRPVLSPDGENLAVLTPRNGHFVLAVIRLESRKPHIVASDANFDISNIHWINNKRILFSMTRGEDVTAEDEDGGGMFAVNLDGSDFRKIVPTIREMMATGNTKSYQFVQTVDDTSNEIIVLDNSRGRDSEFGATDLFKLDTVSARTKLLTFDNPGKVSSWVLDHENVPRIAISLYVESQTKRIKQTVAYRENEKSTWLNIHEAYLDEGKQMTPLGFDFDNKNLFVAGRFNGRDKEAIYLWDFAKKTVGEMIADHPDVDVSQLILDQRRKKIVASFVNTMKPSMIFFDKEYARLQASFNATFPGQEVYFQWRGKNAVVSTRGDNNVGATFLYDTEKKTMEALYVVKPELEGKKLSTQTVINYAARDGLNIPAYLTLPEGVSAKNLPLVAYIHGGPHARDDAGFDPMVQMLASRGYAVLQPQFRMSTGFGWKHHTAGWKQWGLGMQDDVTDGIQSLVDQGIVDKKRICIIGASYGGYAAMYGLIKDPDLYRCAVNWAGVTDVRMLFTVNWSDMSPSMMENLGALMHGDPYKDIDYFHKASAIENADKIKAPVLMAYGSQDRRVPIIHGEKMRDKLLAKGNQVEWMVMVGEGHGWNKDSNKIKWGETVLNFIQRNIGEVQPSKTEN